MKFRPWKKWWWTRKRRGWCMRHDHPMASWSPVCITMRDNDRIGPDGEVTEGTEFKQVAWRCAFHDTEANERRLLLSQREEGGTLPAIPHVA